MIPPLPRVPVLVCLGRCRSVERLSVSDVDIDDGLSPALAQNDCMYYAVSETNLHCSRLAALSASGGSACAAIKHIPQREILLLVNRTDSRGHKTYIIGKQNDCSI